MGDLNKRRGRVLNESSSKGYSEIIAEVPVSEI